MRVYLFYFSLFVKYGSSSIDCSSREHKEKKISSPQAEVFDSNLKGFYAKYNMKEIIGRGVSSVVRRCVDQRTTMQYAAKIIDLTNYQGDDLPENIRRDTLKEIEILQMCVGQPNIIQLRDVFETPAYMFLVFELLVKGELFDYMTEVVTVSEKRTRQIMTQLLDAISFIHARKIVHRDVKPENILLDENLNIKLADFGIASFITTDQDLRELMGTPGYLAPEAVQCSMFENAPGYGRPVDCWASGVIMYTLLSGIPPFWHRRQMVMLRSIMEGNYQFSNPEWSDIRDICKDLVSKLLTVDVRDRLTAPEALRHSFFHPDEISAAAVQKHLDMRYRKFRVAVYALKFIFRLHKLSLQPPEIEVSKLKNNPYSIRLIRRLIDAGAFQIYGHWVQKSEAQNRALLFESEPRKTGSLMKAVYR